MSKHPFIIAIAGNARSGKDTLADIFIDKFKNMNLRACKISFATPLKAECKSLFTNSFNIDLNTCSPQDKELVRPILVEVGAAHRKQTEGKYFTDIWNKTVAGLADHYDVVICPDLRFSEYEEDELQFFQKLNACIIFIERRENGILVPPANAKEEENNPKIKSAASFRLEWNTEQKDQIGEAAFTIVYYNFFSEENA